MRKEKVAIPTALHPTPLYAPHTFIRVSLWRTRTEPFCDSSGPVHPSLSYYNLDRHYLSNLFVLLCLSKLMVKIRIRVAGGVLQQWYSGFFTSSEWHYYRIFEI